MFSHSSATRMSDGVVAIAILVLMYFTSSYNIVIIPGWISMLLSLVSGVAMVLATKRVRTSPLLLCLFLVLCCNVFLTSIVTGDPLKEVVIVLSALLAALIPVVSVDFWRYCRIYTDVMQFLAGYSLVVYLLALVAPSFIRLFPGTYWRPTLETYNLGFAFINLRTKLLRNMGVFWEPGAYQTFLAFAILIEVFLFHRRRKGRLLILGAALLTTWSTTGILVGLLLTYILVIDKYYHSRVAIIRITMAAAIIGFLIGVIYFALPPELQYSAVGKIVVYLQSDRSQMTSASVRFDGIFYALRAFGRSPFLGVGQEGLREAVLEAGHTMATNTPLNWFATFGLVYGSVFLLATFCLARSFTAKPLVAFLVMLAILLSIGTEQYLRNPSVMVFFFYGLAAIGKSRCRPGGNQERIQWRCVM